jgi:hypothetical protein
MQRLVIPTLALLLSSGFAAACGGSEENSGGGSTVSGATGGTGTGATSNATGGTGTGTGGTQLGTGGVVLGAGGSGGGTGSGGDGTGSLGDAACADGSAGGDLAPVYLVFLLDQSGSMGDCVNEGERAKRWEPVESALTTFFTDEASAGLFASLTLFPTEQAPDVSCSVNPADLECTASAYATPVVEPTELPSPVLVDALPDEPNEYGTPSAPALAGTVDYALSLKQQGHKVAIVMVTDGKPEYCSADNTIDNTIAEAVRGATASIPTYVIGVGPGLDNLRGIATGGGTEALIIDSQTGSPEDTQQKLLAKINEIRGQELNCEMPIPEPPAGLTLDPTKVNIEYTTGGATVALAMNEGCAGDGLGWQYDDPIAPTRVEICPATCTEVKGHYDASLNVVFGCDVVVK